MHRRLSRATTSAPVLRCSAFVCSAVLFCSATLWASSVSAEGSQADKSQERRSQIVARFAGDVLTIGDVEDELARQSPFIRRRFADEADYRKEFVERMVRFELLASEAAGRGYHKKEEVEQTVKQNVVQALLRGEFDDKLTPEAIPMETVEAYYQAQIQEFMRPAMSRASHILLADEATAKALLKEVTRADLREFRRLAREHSLDEQTKLRGGDLRYFDEHGRAQGQEVVDVPQPIVDAIFALKQVGDVAPRPIKTDAGYSLVKLTGRRPADTRSVEDAETTIRLRLWRQQRQEAIDAFVNTVRERVVVKLHPELIEQVKLETQAAGSTLAPGFPHTAPTTAAEADPTANPEKNTP